MKIVINDCFGGFSLSKRAQDILGSNRETSRTDNKLIELVEALGKKANGPCASLKVIEIPDDVEDWYLHEYDGLESVKEGRTWC